jgi:hypothetical protein
MKKNIFLIVILILLFLGMSLIGEPAFAAWGRKEKKLTPEELQRETELKEKFRLRDELTQKDWVIYVAPLSPKSLKTRATDVLTFQEGKFVSKNLSAQGYPSSSYTLTTQEDGTVIWEATQNNPKLGLASWRGELKGNLMQGVLSILSAQGEVEDFSFTSVAP